MTELHTIPRRVPEPSPPAAGRAPAASQSSLHGEGGDAAMVIRWGWALLEAWGPAVVPSSSATPLPAWSRVARRADTAAGPPGIPQSPTQRASSRHPERPPANHRELQHRRCSRRPRSYPARCTVSLPQPATPPGPCAANGIAAAPSPSATIICACATSPSRPTTESKTLRSEAPHPAAISSVRPPSGRRPRRVLDPGGRPMTPQQPDDRCQRLAPTAGAPLSTPRAAMGRAAWSPNRGTRRWRPPHPEDCPPSDGPAVVASAAVRGTTTRRAVVPLGWGRRSRRAPTRTRTRRT